MFDRLYTNALDFLLFSAKARTTAGSAFYLHITFILPTISSPPRGVSLPLTSFQETPRRMIKG
ncbi:MAG: hypothetical protein JST43_04125 [Bacteroidetes bacterium]|nr:hypothetical protein [Bacteroidota bacterium]